MKKIPIEFKPYFWDTDFNNLDIKENAPYIISRLYNKGGFPGIFWVQDTYTDDEIIQAIKSRRDFNTIVANYLKEKYKLNKSDMNYYHMKENSIPWR